MGCGEKGSRTPWVWLETRALSIIYLLPHRDALWGAGTRLGTASRLLARVKMVINGNINLHFFGVFYLRI